MDKEKLIKVLESKKQTYPPHAYCDYHNDRLNVAIEIIEEWQDEPITAEGLERLGFERYSGTGTVQYGMIILDWIHNDESTSSITASCAKDGICYYLQIHSCGKTVQLSVNEKMSLLDIYHLQKLVVF